MHKLKSLALVALSAFGLSARGVETTNAWWDVPFTSPTTNGVELTIGELGTLTNDSHKAEVTSAYPYGVWSMVDGDESYITNGIATNWVNGAMVEIDDPANLFLKLDTQGNDLTWTVEQDNAMADGLKALVDADLYLVGSDSPPDAADFDGTHDVQTAVYLRNETDEDTGETTNSILCVYVYNETTEANERQELAGVPLEDNAWAHIQVLVDHADDATKPPTVQVFVNGTPMHARFGDATSWMAANGPTSQAAGRVSSVAFRGTGAVDNFVGRRLNEESAFFDFTAEVYMDGTLVPADSEFDNKTTVLEDQEVKSGTTVTFEGFKFDDWTSAAKPATWHLAEVKVVDPVTGAETLYTYTYDKTGVAIRISADQEGSPVTFVTRTMSGQTRQTGAFSVEVPTEGAQADGTIVKLYFKTLGAYDGFATTTTMGGATTTNAVTVTPADFPEEGSTKTLSWEFPATQGGNILTNLQVYGGATLVYANGKATVSVTLDDVLDADTLFAAATYVAGSLAEGQDLRWTKDGDVYTFAPYTPPVALRVTVAEGVTTTNEYPSLRAAIEAAGAGETVYLVADDRVSFSAQDTEIVIGKALTIDGGSNTLYGVTDYAYDGVNDHDIFIGAAAGDVTIKDLKITEFSDTAPTVQQRTYPIWSSQNYAGKLTLDGVQIDKFARGAINLNGGTFEITNCVIAGYAGAPGAPESYFQNAITVKNAKGTVAETTVTGIGTHEGSPWGAGLVTFNSNGDGEVTFLSGSYTADYVIEVSSNATGRIVISNGTFIATAPKTDEGEPVSAFQFDEEAADRNLTVTISGGWFDREPEAAYLAAGYVAVQDADHAPVAAAPWTVKAAAVQIEGDTTKSYLSIADAQEAAALIADPVFVVIAPLSAETVTLATADATLTVKTDDMAYLANLEVVTSLESTEAVAYGVEPRVVGLEPPITVFYEVVPTYYVAKIVDGATTNRYETFAAAAEAAAAADATLTVEMVASTNAVEIYGLPADYVLMVKKNGFLVPAVDSASRGHYVDESPADETGVTTYSSQPYLTATFLNGDGSVLETVDLLKAGDTPVPTKDDEVEPYPAAQPGYWITHLYNWSPALGPIYTNTTFRPLFTTNVTQYSIQYVLDGTNHVYEALNPAWPAGYTPPEWYAVTNATIELPTPVMDGWTFKGWYTNKVDGVYVGDLMNPGVIPTGSYGPKFFYAAWEEVVVTKPQVDAGDGLAQYAAEHPGVTVPEPLEFVEENSTDKAQLAFVAPEAGTYVLYTSTTVNGTYTEDAGSAKAVAKGELVKLLETTPATTGAKFFKIYWTTPGNNP